MGRFFFKLALTIITNYEKNHPIISYCKHIKWPKFY